jgi:hypothetical protein
MGHVGEDYEVDNEVTVKEKELVLNDGRRMLIRERIVITTYLINHKRICQRETFKHPKLINQVNNPTRLNQFMKI